MADSKRNPFKYNELSARRRYMILRNQLDMDRSSFTANWRDIADYVSPTRPRWFLQDRNRGERRNFKIINSRATIASRTLASGMMAGITSPARPWFNLLTPYPELNENGAVKDWLYDTTNRMNGVFERSNLYNTLPQVYRDLGDFGTAPMYLEEDADRCIHTSSIPLGSYWLGKDAKGQVNVYMREWSMTIRNCVMYFGMQPDGSIDWSLFSQYVKNQWDLGMFEGWIDIVHVIEPNDNFIRDSIFAKHKMFKSVFFERGTTYGAGSGATQDQGYMIGPDENKLLREKGYDYFPMLVPRWSITGEDVYATDCPGMTAIGDIKQLQFMEKKTAKAVDKQVDPPMIAPSSMANSKSSILPGDITYADLREGAQGFKPVHEVKFELEGSMALTQKIENRISEVYFANLFLDMINDENKQPVTAREVQERHDEKLMAIGPVLQQIDLDLLDPLIAITFNLMVKQKRLKPAPPQMRGVQLKVEYISILAQAQKLIGIQSDERFIQTVQGLAEVFPESTDKVDIDKWIDNYGDNLSIRPGIVRSDDDVKKIRQQKAKAQKQQQQSEQIANQSVAAKNLSQADTGDGTNALQKLMEEAKAGNLAPTQ